jgi:hypothetical protein
MRLPTRRRQQARTSDHTPASRGGTAPGVLLFCLTLRFLQQGFHGGPQLPACLAIVGGQFGHGGPIA